MVPAGGRCSTAPSLPQPWRSGGRAIARRTPSATLRPRRPGIRRHITSRPTSPRTGDQAVPAGHIEVLRNGGITHMLRLQSPLPERLHRRPAADELRDPDRGGQGRPRLTGS